MAYMCQRGFQISRVLSRSISPSISSLPSDKQCTSRVHRLDVSNFSTTATNALKEIQVKKEGNVTQIEGVFIEDPDKKKLLNLETPHPKICPVCPHKLKVDIKYTDVLIISQFLKPDGCLLPRRVTGLCAKAQRKVEKLVHRAQRAGLMPEYRPDLPDGRTRDSHRSNYKWRKYNAFFEDDE